MKLAQRFQQVGEALLRKGKDSIRTVAQQTGRSKSSVHRRNQAIEGRQKYPESWLWETEEGLEWLTRLVWATLYCFGIKQGVGSDCLSEFFHRLHLEQRIGVSPDCLRKLEVKLKDMMIAYEQQQSFQEACEPPIEICVGPDEVFFGDPILVMLELVSGFIFIETQALNRQYKTWQEQVQSALPFDQFHCRLMVSDQAKALIKLALDSLGCRWVPDLFHALWNLGKPIGSHFGRHLAQLNRQLQTLEGQLNKAQQQGKPTESIAAQQQELATVLIQTQQAQQTYHQALEQISTQVHPFKIEKPGIQTVLSLQQALQTPLNTLETLAQTWSIAKANKAIQSFKDQIPAISMGINAWWQWVLEALEAESVSGELAQWLMERMLPWVYWTQQVQRTKHPQRKALYQQAVQQAYAALTAHSLTQTLSLDEQQRWWSWSMEMVSKFQRTSSAVEGRNGCLAQLHHAHRGIDPKTLQVFKIIHNYDLRRVDGTTAAQRLFGKPFPDLFESVLMQMDELPKARRYKKFVQPQMPTLHAVPS